MSAPKARPAATPLRALHFDDGVLRLLDQRALPLEERFLELRSAEQVAEAIESLAVRGAPALACAAAFGLVLAGRASGAEDLDALAGELGAARARLAGTRPTAANLFRVLERMDATLEAALREPGADCRGVVERLEAEARKILAEDLAICRAIGAQGLPLLADGVRVFTHCNTGSLATGGYGTALGMVRAAHEAGRAISVLAGETRPFLQGARLTAWELAREGIEVTVVTDSMAGHLMRCGEADVVVVGADRIAANGDVANKIGTYGLAVLARHHGLPFYVASPISTIDLATPSGADIPIEERGRAEVAEIGGQTLVPAGVPVRHPAFDVTPAELVDAIVTERGIARPPYAESLAALLHQGEGEAA